MKLNKRIRIKSSKLKTSIEDLKYLQRKISGKSVYRRISNLDTRKPKHRKSWLQYY